MPPWEKYAAQPETSATGPWTRYGGQDVPAPAPQPARGGMFANAPDWMRQAAQESAAQAEASNAAIPAMLNRAGESMTFGLVGDEAAAAFDQLIGRGDYDERLAQYRQQEQDLTGGQRFAADIAGALLPAATGAGLVGQASTLGGRVLRGAGLGAGAGATQGFMEGEGGFENRLQSGALGAGIGAAAGGAIPLAGGLIGGMAGSIRRGNIIREAGMGAPTTQELRALGNQLYNQVDEAGVQIRPEALGQARQEILDYLRTNTGFDELPGPGSLTPRSSRTMDIMQALTETGDEAVPFRSIDQLRRQAGAAAGDITNRVEQSAGSAIIQGLDDFVGRLGPDEIAGGDPKTLQAALGKAREVWGRMSRAEAIETAAEQAENYLSGGASGMRNQLARILRSPRLSRGFSDAEKQALRRAIDGGLLERFSQTIGGGLGQIAGTFGGFASGGIPGALAGGAATQGARAVSESLANRSINQVRDAIATGQLRHPAVVEALASAGQGADEVVNAILFGTGLTGARQFQ